MSKFVDEILLDIENNPESFKNHEGHRGIEKGNIVVSGFGNSLLLSIIDVYIDDRSIPLTWIDKYRLEKAIGDWYRTMPLKVIEKITEGK